MRTKLADEVRRTRRVSVVVRPALYASVCAGCDRIFDMDALGHREGVGDLHGIFDRCALDADGRGLGNIFSAAVCSFGCAQKVVDGRWKRIARYKPYIAAGASLERLELRVTNVVRSEKEIRAAWEAGELPTESTTISWRRV